MVLYMKKRIEKWKESKYQEIFGVTKETFEKMLDYLQGERPPNLSVLDKLLITLSHYREYRTMDWLRSKWKYGLWERSLGRNVLISRPTFISEYNGKVITIYSPTKDVFVEFF